MDNTLNDIKGWHHRARPNPTDKDFNVQLGCHLEEVCEMLAALEGASPVTSDVLFAANHALSSLSDLLKNGAVNVTITDREAFVDSLADQIVTAVGVGHCAGMDVPLATEIVDQSNWSKFVNGFPVFDENGKIAKPPSYQPPDLKGCY